MTRLLLAGVLLGALAAAAMAWSLRDQVAYAAELPRVDPQSELVAAAVEGCSRGLGVAQVQVQAGVFVVRCTPDLGVGPPVARRKP